MRRHQRRCKKVNLLAILAPATCALIAAQFRPMSERYKTTIDGERERERTESMKAKPPANWIQKYSNSVRTVGKSTKVRWFDFVGFAFNRFEEAICCCLFIMYVQLIVKKKCDNFCLVVFVSCIRCEHMFLHIDGNLSTQLWLCIIWLFMRGYTLRTYESLDVWSALFVFINNI